MAILSLKRSLKRKQSTSLSGNIVIIIILLMLSVFMLLPFIYAIMQSLKPIDELFAYPPKFYVISPSLDSYYELLVLTGNSSIPFGRYVINSIFIAVAGTFCNVVFSSMAAFPLAKVNFPGCKTINRLIVVALLFTAPVMSVPQYIIMANIGIIDTYWALLLPQLASTLGLFLMRNFMTQINNSIMDSAKVDGANMFTMFWRIVMPSVKPAWLTLIIFSFQNLWNCQSAMGGTDTAFIYSEKLKQIPTVLNQIVSSNTLARTDVSYAITVIMLVPPILIFLFAQSNVVETMTYSGIKE